MRQLDLFSALQSSTEGIDIEFESARGSVLDAAQALRQSVLSQ